MQSNHILRRHGAVLQALMMLAAVGLIFWAVNTPAVVGVSASKRELPVYCVQQDEKIVALSFDAAWGNEDTQTLIDILDQYGVNTTFFVVGDWVDKYPESVQALAEAGNEVMNHSSSHAHFSTLSTNEITSDISACNDKIEAITKAGIVVFGHIGLTPQSSAAMGGFKVQGKNTATAKAIIDDAVAVYKAGARCLLLEGVPEEVCAFVHKILPIPVYGIGAGIECDGQVLLAADALGMYKNFTPKFAKKYCDIGEIATQGMRDYIREVKERQFPAPEHKYKFTGDKEEFSAFLAGYEKDLDL